MSKESTTPVNGAATAPTEPAKSNIALVINGSPPPVAKPPAPTQAPNRRWNTAKAQWEDVPPAPPALATPTHSPKTPAPTPKSSVIYSHAALQLPKYGRSGDYAKRIEKQPIVQDNIPKTVDATMAKILQWRRGHNSEGEKAFHKWLTDELAKRLRLAFPGKDVEVPKVQYAAESKTNETAAFVVRVPRREGGDSTTLFSCHIDTVDRARASASMDKQAICYDPHLGHIFVDPAPNALKGDCLGADDGVGIWMMLNMISAAVPGTYVFHRGEECGSIGANILLREHAEFLETHELAIAFDRPDDNEIITHQGNQRCASDKCANALKAALKTQGLEYELSTRGVFTDTKVYRGIIDECFNLGVGYYNQHSNQEHLNYAHACKLLSAVTKIDWDSLPIDRDCKAKDPQSTYTGGYYGRGGTYRGWGHGHEELDAELEEDIERGLRAERSVAGRTAPKANAELKPTREQILAASRAKSVLGKRVDIDDPSIAVMDMSATEILDFCNTHAPEAALLIGELAAELAAERARIETYRKLLGLHDV